MKKTRELTVTGPAMVLWLKTAKTRQRAARRENMVLLNMLGGELRKMSEDEKLHVQV